MEAKGGRASLNHAQGRGGGEGVSVLSLAACTVLEDELLVMQLHPLCDLCGG